MKLIKGLILFIAPFALAACGSDGGGTSDSEVSVTLTSSTPSNGAIDVAISTKTIELTYSAEVNFVSGVNADFDGQSCGLTSFSKKSNVVTFTIPSQLKMGQQYTLSIPSGFFVSANGGGAVPEHSSPTRHATAALLSPSRRDPRSSSQRQRKLRRSATRDSSRWRSFTKTNRIG